MQLCKQHLEAGLPPRRDALRCHCGELVKIGAYARKGNYYFCEAHRAEADDKL
jgi:hypothetical protein